MGPNHFVLLAQGNQDELGNALERIRHDLDGALAIEVIDQLLIPRPHAQLLPGIFSLVEQSMLESLVVVETQSASGLLAAAQLLMDGHGLKAIEIKLSRLGFGLGFFTGEHDAALAAAEDARTHMRDSVRTGRIEVVSQPPSKFREFFNLDGVS